jgi:hypothetical protein
LSTIYKITIFINKNKQYIENQNIKIPKIPFISLKKILKNNMFKGYKAANKKNEK